MKLTERDLLTSAVTSSDLIHIVLPNDPTQSPEGSSYKVDLGKVINDLVPKDVTYTNLSESTITVGGIPSGTTFDNKSMKYMWDLLLYPFQPPQFTSFSRTGILSEYELGRPVSAATETFTWDTSFSTNVSANTITIQQITPSLVTLSGGTPNDGSESINLSSQQTISASTTVTLELYRITGTNTKGTTFTSSISRTWKYRWYYGKSSSSTLTNVQITGLTNTGLVTSVKNFGIVFPAGVGEYLYVVTPSDLPQPTNWVDSASGCSGFPVSYITVGTTSFSNSYGVSTNYTIYRSEFAIGSSQKVWLCA